MERVLESERKRIAAMIDGEVATLLRASESWRGIRITEFALRRLDPLRNELNEQFAAARAPAAKPIYPTSRSRITARTRLDLCKRYLTQLLSFPKQERK